MTVRRRRDNQWYYRKWMRLPNGSRGRIFGVPGSWGLPNTKLGATTALDKHVAWSHSTGLLKRPTHALTANAEPSGPTIHEFARVFLAASELKNKHSSLESKEQILDSHILPDFGDRSMVDVDYAAIEDFKVALRKKGLKAKTVNNVLTVLRRMLVIAAKRKVITAVPDIEWLPVEPAEFDFLTFDEAERLIDTADGEWKTMIWLAVRTGLRQGELLGVRWEDIDLATGLLRVRQAIVRGQVTTPKSRKEREIPLAPSAVGALKAHRHLRGPLVFCNTDGAGLTKGECKHPLWRACKRAGIRRIGWHVLRHTFASHLAMRGVPLRTIQELMGHSTIAMTLRYAHLAPEITRDAVTMLDAGHPVPAGGANGQKRTPSGGR